MAKVAICDVCKAEGKLSYAGWYVRMKRGYESLRLDICGKHRGYTKGKTFEQVLNSVGLVPCTDEELFEKNVAKDFQTSATS